MIQRVIGLMFIIVSASCEAAPAPGASGLAPLKLQGPLFHKGMCDASAAIAVGPNTFVVASDEDNVLRYYRSDATGDPIRIQELDSFLRPDPKDPEVDIEGAARVGDRAYWISSHGRNKKGKEEKSRYRFFATDIKKDGSNEILQPVGQPYAGLVGDLLGAPELSQFNLRRASELPPKEFGALNIEGLSGRPDGSLLIGFRNPIPGKKALLVPLLNPNEVINGQLPKLGPAILLDLGGLGIRSIEWIEDKYYIMAGPFEGMTGGKIVTWKGGADAPVEIPIAVKGFSPEAFLFYPGNTKRVQLFSDDGSLKINGQDCKTLKNPLDRQFRTFWAELN